MFSFVINFILCSIFNVCCNNLNTNGGVSIFINIIYIYFLFYNYILGVKQTFAIQKIKLILQNFF